MGGVDTGTWRRGHGLVLWSYDLPRPASAQAARDELRRVSRELLAALGDFAIAREIELNTRSGGEAAVSRSDPAGLGPEDLERMLDEHTDADQVSLLLALRVSADGIAEEEIVDGATTWVSLDWPDPERAGEGAPSMSMAVSLHVDIYAAESWGKSRENRALSVINAPRLNRFLARVREDVGGSQTDLDSGDYGEQVSADGFAPPTSTTH